MLLVCCFIDFLLTVHTYICYYSCAYSCLCSVYICVLSVICERYYFILLFLCYIFTVCVMGFVVLTYVAVSLSRCCSLLGCCIAALSVCGDCECSVQLVTLFKKGTGVCAAIWYGFRIRF
jgi:hypothetical protein